MENQKEAIVSVLNSLNAQRTFLTSPSISEGHNYIVTTSDDVKRLLEKAIGAKFNGNVGQTSKLLLRKEILKILTGSKS